MAIVGQNWPVSTLDLLVKSSQKPVKCVAFTEVVNGYVPSTPLRFPFG